MANKNKLKPKGHLYISSPTLEGLALLCENAKKAAHISGIEYSNFLKACKMEKDIRFSTYRKCAAGLGKEVLVIHLPLGTIESMIEPKTHVNGFYETIEQDKLIKVLMAVMPSDGSPLDVPMMLFGWDKTEDMHIYRGEKSKEDKEKRKTDELLLVIKSAFRTKLRLSYQELCEVLMREMEIKDRTAKKYIAYMKEQHILTQDTSGNYQKGELCHT